MYPTSVKARASASRWPYAQPDGRRYGSGGSVWHRHIARLSAANKAHRSIKNGDIIVNIDIPNASVNVEFSDEERLNAPRRVEAWRWLCRPSIA